MKASARVVYFSYEMFNDALYFLEQAKELDPAPHNDWIRWRYLRATILYSFICLESVINGLIIGKAKDQGKTDLVKNIKNESISIICKIGVIYPNLLDTKFDKDRKEWNYFMDIRRIRNLITHYAGGVEIYNEKNPNGVTLKNAEKAIEMVRILIKHLYDLSALKTPNWIQ